MRLLTLILSIGYILLFLLHPIATIFGTLAVGLLAYGLAYLIIQGNKDDRNK